MEPIILECTRCGQPGEPSWGDLVLCETCYGTLGATCGIWTPETGKDTEDLNHPIC